MAPDFASMAGMRLRRSGGAGALAEGIAFHHLSDDAFHGAPIFVELMKATRVDLCARGLGQGPARAIGHVGVELLLDGYLVTRDGIPAEVREAVTRAGSVANELEFRGDDPRADRDRWREVCGRIADSPLPQGYSESTFVAERLLRILARRPRLAVDPGRGSEVFRWAEDFSPVVSGRAEALLCQVEERLALTKTEGPTRQ